MPNIYGTIGYVFLIKGSHKIIVLADQHDTLPECQNKINVGQWFKKKINTSKILLEEVPREDNKLIELWQTSPHTQELKNLYLDNPKMIPGMDIRPFMIPFSWEVLEQINEPDNNYDIDMIEYFKEIDNFFSMQHTFVISNISNYNVNILKDTLLGKHFLMLKNRYNDLLESLNQKKLLTQQIRFLNTNHNNLLILINNLLDDIMEWYIFAQINLYYDKSIIIHAGLAHTEKIIKLLQEHYNYEIKKQQGVNNLNESKKEPRNGCIQVSENIDELFGGGR